MFDEVIIFDVRGAPGDRSDKLHATGASTGPEQMARWGDRGAFAAWNSMKVSHPR